MKLKPKNTTLNQRALVYRRYTHLVDSETLNNAYKTSDNKYWLFNANSLSFKEIQQSELTNDTNIIEINSTQIYRYQNYCFRYIEDYGGYAYWQKILNTPKKEYSFENEPVYPLSLLNVFITQELPIFVGVKNGVGNVTISNPTSNELTINMFVVEGNTSSTLSSTIQPNETKQVISSQGGTFTEDFVIKGIKVSSSVNSPISIQLNINGYDVFPFTDTIATLFPKIATIAKYQKNTYYYVGSFAFMLRGSVSGSTSQYIKGNIVPLTSMNIKYFDDSVNLQVDDLVVVNGKLYSVENPETDFKFQPKGYKIHFVTLNNIL